MNSLELKEILKKDFFRHYGYYPKNVWFKGIFGSEGCRYIFFFRLAHYFKTKRCIIKPFISLVRIQQSRITKVSLSKMTNIGPGLNIFHLKNINIEEHSKIGSNFTIGHQVTVGMINHGKLKGAPEIGDNVFIGPGALVIGNIKIGNNVLIAGNSFVTQDVPSDSFVYGNPCVIKHSKKATDGYIVNRI